MFRIARRATIALLVVGALSAIALVAWSIYIRSQPLTGERAGVRSGLELAAHLNTEYLAIIGALGIAAAGLAYAMWKDMSWAYLASSIGSAVAIGGVWFARTIVVRLEDPRFVKKSPWVKAATFVATVATVYLAIVIVTSALAWFARRKTQPT